LVFFLEGLGVKLSRK